MALVLTSLDDEGIERRIEQGKTLSIGRGTDNDLVLVDPSREVSKTHCRIEADGDRYTLVDLSINGVTLDGHSTPMGPGARHELKTGDVFVIARQRFAVAIAPEGTGADETPTAAYAMPTASVPHDIGQILDGAAEGVESRASLGVSKEATPWLNELPPGAADETIRQPMGWETPPATDAILPLDFDQPAASDFANRSEHVPAANNALYVPRVTNKATHEGAEPVGAQIPTQIPSDWLDEPAHKAAGPEPAPRPARTANRPTGPSHAPAPAADTAALRRAFAEGGRFDPATLSGLSDDALMRRCGEALRAFLEGLDSSEAAQGVAELDCGLSSPVKEGLWADFFATNRDPLVALLVEPQPGPGPALAQRVSALADRQRALGHAVAEAAHRYDAVLAPAAIEAETRHRFKPGPVGRAAAWARYVGLHGELADGAPEAGRAPSFLLLLRKSFARAMTKRP